MRVLVIGDHNVNAGGEFEAERIAHCWREAAPHASVTAIPVANNAQAVPAVWRHQALKRDGFSRTALVTIDPNQPNWAELVARDIFDAIRNSIVRIVIAMPRYSRPDAGVALLDNLDRLLSADGKNAQSDSANVLLKNPQAFHDAIGRVGRLLQGVDVLLGYTENMPLTGMHGMSGTAALLGDLEQEEAQSLEREIAGLLFGLTKIGVTPTAHSSRSLLSSNQESSSYKDLARHDAAGSAGGAAFMLLAAGGRALPLARILSAQFDLPQAVQASDLIVVKQEILDGRTHDLSTLGVVSKLALNHAVPVIALTEEQIMSTRELASNGISACYVVKPEDLEAMSVRLAGSWTPRR